MKKCLKEIFYYAITRVPTRVSYLTVSITEWLHLTLCDSSCRTKNERIRPCHSLGKAAVDFQVPFRRS